MEHFTKNFLFPNKTFFLTYLKIRKAFLKPLKLNVFNFGRHKKALDKLFSLIKKQRIKKYILAKRTVAKQTLLSLPLKKNKNGRIVLTNETLIQKAVNFCFNKTAPGFRSTAKAIGCDTIRLQKLFPLGLINKKGLIKKNVPWNSKEFRALAAPLVALNHKGEIGIGEILQKLQCSRKTLTNNNFVLVPLQPVYRILDKHFELKQQKTSQFKKKEMLSIINNHNSQNVDFIYCEACLIKDHLNCSISEIGQIDHIFGRKYEKLEYKRVLCPNCHNHSVRRSLPDKFFKKKLPNKIDYTKTNLFQNIPSPGGDFDHLNNRLLKQKLVIDCALLKSKQKQIQRINEGASVQTSVYVDLLISSGIKKQECENCSIKNWKNLPIGPFLQGHHKDGNNKNNKISNLGVLCANCHACAHSNYSVSLKSPLISGVTSKIKTFQLPEPAIEAPTPKTADDQGLCLNSNLKNPKSLIRLDSSHIKDFLSEKRVCTFYAILSHPNRPTTFTDCARLANISVISATRMAKKYFPHLLVTDRGATNRIMFNKEPWISQGKAIQAFINLEKTYAPINKTITAYRKEHKINERSWYTIKKLLEKAFEQGINPFLIVPLTLEELNIPNRVPFFEENKT